MVEEIIGDLNEQFRINSNRRGIKKAKFLFYINALGFLRFNIIKRQKYNRLNNMIMVENYLKVAIRNLLKNKLISFINVFGLALAIGVCMVVFLFIEGQYNMDKFHVNQNRIYLINNIVNRDGNIQVWGDSPVPIGGLIKQDFPQVEEVVRMVWRTGVVRYGEEVFSEGITFVDPSFFNVFTFPLKWGDEESIRNESMIILSERMSKKYFGEGNPVGKQITFRVSDERTESFTVGGVFQKFSKKASFDFNFLTHISRLEDVDQDFDWGDWGAFINATFIMLRDPTDIAILENGMSGYVELHNKAEQDWPAENYVFEPLTTLSINSQNIRRSISGAGDDIARTVLAIMGAFMIVLACSNYINIAIVSVAKRLKEIGIRKVMGALKMHLVLQFLIENIILTILALVIGIALAGLLFIRWFENLFSVRLEFDLSNPALWVFFVGITLVTGIISGAYPAFYISSFKPVDIFRGSQKFGSKSRLTKIFIAFQFVLSIITIIGGIMFIQNTEYQKNRDWGYNQKSTVVVRVSDFNQFTQIKNRVVQNADVVKWAGSASHIGRSIPLSVIEVEGTKFKVRRFDVGENYVETYDIKLTDGRFLDHESETDRKENVVINRMMAKNMEWGEPLGKTFWYDSTVYNVVGLVEDFHYNSFFNEIESVFFRLVNEEEYRYLSVRTSEGNAIKMSEFLEETWHQEFPDLQYNGFFQNEVFFRYFNEISGHGKIMGFVATLSIILSCIGLFGLVSLNIANRLKEFSIRKVLGANLQNIAKLINMQFVWLLLIAIVIGGPAGFYLIKMLMEMIYVYHMPIGIMPVVNAAIILIITTLLTTSLQIRRVLINNPVDALRIE